MFYQRKIYEKLLKWKNESRGEKALLIEGARRVGKSTAVEKFAQNEYESYLLIDFSKTSARVKNIFRNHLDDIDLFYQLLEAELKSSLVKRKSLLVFDEVQKFPRAREAVKTLVADGRYDLIETGSLISIRENSADILIPSEEKSISMYPMDFEEFCIACGEEGLLSYIRDCFNKLSPLEDSVHRKAMLLLKQYMIVGGMPQSVKAYLENGKSFIHADREKRDILNLYRNDIRKISRKYKTKVLQVFEQIPGFLSTKEKRVVLNKMEGNPQFDSYSEAFFWLADSMIVNECFNCSDPNVGLSLNEDRTYIKCYMGDTGLLISHTFSEKEISEGELYRTLLNDRLSINKGMFFENLAAQMLSANGFELFFYTHYSNEKHRNDIEIDFLVSNGSKTKFKVNPIEVKSSKNYTVLSLDAFKNKFNNRIGTSYVVHPKNLKIENDTVFLPVYMTYLL
ncbi:MAG: ATP-binding protein [Thermoguttaceae bacterium]|nr:ATP-binding protein [Thermoguttaceae bacterium]